MEIMYKTNSLKKNFAFQSDMTKKNIVYNFSQKKTEIYLNEDSNR